MFNSLALDVIERMRYGMSCLSVRPTDVELGDKMGISMSEA